MINCPACAGPQALGGGCATCNGTTFVSEEVAETFLAEQAKANQYFAFQDMIREMLIDGFDKEISFTIDGETFTHSPS